MLSSTVISFAGLKERLPEASGNKILPPSIVTVARPVGERPRHSEPGLAHPGRGGATIVVEETGIKRTADWKTAYVIGLAGTALVTGVAGPVVGALGTVGCLEIILVVACGSVYCLFLAELATMFPEKVGGLPTYAVEGFRDKKWAGALGGLSSWAYWLGWSPVIAVNTSLMATYAAILGGFHERFFSGVLPIWPGGYAYLLAFEAVISILLYGVNYYGLVGGYRSSLLFAALTLCPLLFIGFAPFLAGVVRWNNILPLNTGNVTAPILSAGWWSATFPWYTVVTWNALAMESTACYLGETKNPLKDGPKALTLAALTALVVYTAVPLALLGVLGSTSVAADPWGAFITVVSAFAGQAGVYAVAAMLFGSLLLSSTGALIGCARSLYQSSVEGLTIGWFGKINRHGSPSRAMLFAIVFNGFLVLCLAGLPTLIYVVSNCGYIFSFIPTGIAYIRLKRGYAGMPNRPRPYSLPRPMWIVAAVLVVFFASVFLVAGPLSPYSVYSIAGLPVDPIIFWASGMTMMLLGIPMYLIRKRSRP
jgi:amino acid transporter